MGGEEELTLFCRMLVIEVFSWTQPYVHPTRVTFADTGKGKVLGLGRVAISKDQHMDKVMLVESLGYNLMSVSMLCDLYMVVVFGKYRCVVIMEADNSKVFKGFREEICVLLISLQDHNLLHVYLQKLQKAGYGIDDLVMLA